MRQSDRPGAGSFDAHQDSLAQRLARLPDRHPSSPQADWPERRPEDEDPADSADTGDPEQAQDEPLRPDEARDRRPEHTRPPGLRPAAPGLTGSSRAGRDPYRPWFAEGGQAPPWFAADPVDPEPGGP